MSDMLCFSRSRSTSVERLDAETLRARCSLRDTLTEADVEILVRLPDLEITAVRGEVARSERAVPSDIPVTIDKAVGIRIGADVFKIIDGRIAGTGIVGELRFMVKECCACAREAVRLSGGEAAKRDAGDEEGGQEEGRAREKGSGIRIEQVERAQGDRTRSGTVIDLHVHTYPASPCSSGRVDQLIMEAKQIGLDGICLTDHNHVWRAFEIEKLRQKYGFLVLGANEITTDQGDMLVFGLDIRTRGIARLEALREMVSNAGGFIVAAHPFRGFPVVGSGQKGITHESAVQRAVFKFVDGVEVLNSKVTEMENRFAFEVASMLGLPGTGGSDAHQVSEVGLYATRFEGKIRNEEELLEALRGGMYSAVKFGRRNP